MISEKKQKFTKCRLKSKSKQINHINHKTKNIKHKTLIGSGVFNNISSSIGSAIYHKPKEKDYSVHMPGSQYTKFLNPETAISKVQTLTTTKSPSLLTVVYNYHKPNQLNLNNVSSSKVLSSGQVEYEPHITVDNMNRYLVIMYDTNKKKLHWVIEFKNRSKYKTILSYLSPKPKDGTAHKYVIQLIKYPDNITPFTVEYMNNPKRRKMFKEVFSYIKTNNLLPAVFTKSFNVKFDMSSGISIFNILSNRTKNTHKYT